MAYFTYQPEGVFMITTTVSGNRVHAKTKTQAVNFHTFVAAWLGETFDAMDALIYFIVLYPCLGELLKTKDATTIGWHGSIILAFFMVGWAIGSITFGLIADRYGRRVAMTSSILVYAIGSVLCSFSQSWMHLAACRLLVGFGIGGEISIGSVLLSESWQGKGRIWAMCLMQTSFCCGSLLTGAFNLSIGQGSWRLLFLIGMLPALVALYVRWHLNEPQAFQALKEYRQKLKFKPPKTLTPEQRQVAQMPIASLMERANLQKLALTTTLCMSAIVGYWAAISWMPAWINQLTVSDAVVERSTATMLMSLGGIAVCFICPPLTTLLGRRVMFLIGFAGSLASVLFLFLGIHAYGPSLLKAVFFVGIFSSIPFIIVSFYIPELFDTHLLGTASGISWSIGRIAAAIAGLFTGPVIAFFGGSYSLAASSIALVYLAGLAASCFVKEPQMIKKTSPFSQRHTAEVHNNIKHAYNLTTTCPKQ